MSRYRKIEVKTWMDEKFRELSPMPPSGQGLWLFLMTGPHTGPVPGLFRAGRAGMAEELGWDTEAFDKAFGEVYSLGMAKADFKARLVWLPKALKHNKPESPNVVRSWRIEFELLPECDLKREAMQHLREQLASFGDAYVDAFDEVAKDVASKPSRKPSPKAMANQEQEQEQQQEQENPSGSSPDKPARRRQRGARFAPDDFVVTPEMQAWAATDAPNADWQHETEKFRDWEFKHPRTDWCKVWRTWMRKASEEAASKSPRRTSSAPPAESFAERDRRAAMERWEQMTGQVHPDREPRAPLAHVIDEPIPALGAPA